MMKDIVCAMTQCKFDVELHYKALGYDAKGVIWNTFYMQQKFVHIVIPVYGETETYEYVVVQKQDKFAIIQCGSMNGDETLIVSKDEAIKYLTQDLT
jgi:hypothetical protein